MASITTTTTQTGDRRYRVRYRDPGGNTREKWFKRKIDADRWSATTEADKARGLFIDPQAGRVTVGEWLAEWWTGRSHIRQSTRATQDSLIRNHILPAFGKFPIGSVRTSQVRDWVVSLELKGLSPSTIRASHALLAGCLEAATVDRLIPRNPARGVDLPKTERRPMRILNHLEIAELASSMDDRYEPMVLLGAYGGLRFGEVAALKTESIDFLRRSVEITTTLNEVQSKIIIGPPKTPRSRRRVALPEFVCQELAAHVARFSPEPDGLLFTAPEGGAIRRHNWRRRVWKPAVASSVGEPCTFHDLRHSSAALLIQAGQHAKVIQERLGHSSIKTTLDVYGHLFPGMDEAAAEALDKMARGVGVGLGRVEAAS